VELETIKRDLAVRTMRGLPMILAGCVLWLGFSIAGLLIPAGQWQSLIYLFGAGLLLPGGLAIGALIKVDLFAKGNPLGTLVGYLGGLQILFIPLMIASHFLMPEVVPWFLAILVGAHFLPFSWVYESRAYLFCSLGLVLAGALTGFMFSASSFIVAPSLATLVLIGTAFGLWREHRSLSEA
jgi:hypothetical protein